MNVSGCLEGRMGNQNSISLQPNLPEKWCMSGGYFNRGKKQSLCFKSLLTLMEGATIHV